MTEEAWVHAEMTGEKILTTVSPPGAETNRILGLLINLSGIGTLTHLALFAGDRKTQAIATTNKEPRRTATPTTLPNQTHTVPPLPTYRTNTPLNSETHWEADLWDEPSEEIAQIPSPTSDRIAPTAHHPNTREDHSTEAYLSLTPEEKKEKLWRNVSRYEWLMQLLLTKPLLVWGSQCSGKTSFVGLLALLRVIFFEHEVSGCDPHAHQNEWPKWFQIVGAHYNYGEIDKRFDAYRQRLKTSNNGKPHTSLWDELTNYKENCQNPFAAGFLKSILSDVRKPPEFPILMSHGNTLAALGGGEGGVKRMQIQGLVEVHLLAARDPLGNLHPALKGSVTGLKTDETTEEPLTEKIKLEEWMQPSWILERFPELDQAQTPVSPPPLALVKSGNQNYHLEKQQAAN